MKDLKREIEGKLNSVNKKYSSRSLAYDLSDSSKFKLCDTKCNSEKKCKVDGKYMTCLSNIDDRDIQVFDEKQKREITSKILTDYIKRYLTNKNILELENKFLNTKVMEIDTHDESSKLQDTLKDENIDINYMLKKTLNDKQIKYDKDNQNFMSRLDILDQLKKTMEKNNLEKDKYVYKMKYIIPIFIILLILFLVLNFS